MIVFFPVKENAVSTILSLCL